MFSNWIRRFRAKKAAERRARPRLEVLEDRMVPTTFATTNFRDSGPGSLRQAILDSNASPGSNSITFNLPGAGLHLISLLSPLPAILTPTTIDGSTQPGYNGTPVIALSGAAAGPVANGLVLAAGNSTVKGLDIENFAVNGIVIMGAGGNTVSNTFLGTNASGTAAAANGNAGLVINNSSGNQIGANDVISGNGTYGVVVYGPGATQNSIIGDYIGTDLTGKTKVANGSIGVEVAGGASRNTVTFDVVSGNGYYGFWLGDRGTTGNSLANDYVGVDVSGSVALPNLFAGVGVGNTANNNTVGGNNLSAKNVIAGNPIGVYIDGAGTTINLVNNDYLGLNAAGTAAFAGQYAGVYIDNGATGNGVVGAVVSGATFGVVLDGAGTSSNNILSNLIGTSATGAVAVGDGTGVTLQSGASANAVIGDVISGNTIGVQLTSGASGNLVRGNLIGLKSDGVSALGNSSFGVLVTQGAANNTIGGTRNGVGNRIAFSGDDGVLIGASPGAPSSSLAGSGNGVMGNSIFSNGKLAVDLGFDDGVTANDSQGHVGPDRYENFPILTAATVSNAQTSVQGTYANAAESSTPMRIEFYVNSTNDPSGHGQGKTYLGFTNITTDANGNASFSAILSATTPGQFIAVTATDSSGNTSEFSSSMVVSIPSASLSASITGLPASGHSPEGSAVTVSASVSGGASGADQYSWTVLKNQATFASGIGAQFTFTPDDNAAYQVSLTVTDSASHTASASQPLTVDNVLPSATLPSAFSGTAGVGLTITAQTSDPSLVDMTAGLQESWSFGDGSSTTTTGSGAVSTTHAYASAGKYTVQLTVKDKDGGQSLAATSTVTIAWPQLTTSIVGLPSSGHSPEGSAVSVSANMSGGAPGTDQTNWAVTENGQLVAAGSSGAFTFTPATPGTYQISLTVTDSAGNTAAANASLASDAVAPTVTLAGPYKAAPNSAISFTANAFDAVPAVQAAGYTYSWLFGDGASTTGTTGTVSHAYALAGNYTVSVTVTDRDGVTASATASVTADPPLIVNAGPSESGNEGSAITFSGTAGGGSGALSYSWSFGDGATGLGSLTPSHTYAIFGAYTATLTVRDALGSVGSSITTVTVNDIPPTVTIGGPYTGLVGSAINFTGSATDPIPQEVAAGFSYSWNFGDGGVGSGASTSHTYASPGVYTVALTATDEAGVSTTATTNVPVYSTVILDDSQPGYTEVGPGWMGWGAGYGGNLRYNVAGPGAASAIWQGNGLTPGTYIVQATWSGSANHASAATYSIYDGNTLVQTATISQTVDPVGPVFGGVPFQTLANITLNSGTIRVVVVNQGGGQLVADAIRVAPAAAAPTATFSGPASVIAGSTSTQVTFTNVAGGTGGYTYSYDFNNSGTFAITGSSSPTATIPASYLATGPATLVVHGRISDNSNNFRDYTTTITVVPPPPQATISGAPASGHTQQGTPITVQGSVSHPASGATYGYAWQVTDNNAPFANGSSIQFTFTPNDHGTYVITLTATDQSNNSISATQTVAADIMPPSATLVAPSTVNAGSAFTVALTNPTDPSSAATAAGFHYAFVLDGGSLANASYASASTSAGQSFTFNDGPSNHTVTVRILANDGGFADYTAAIHVNYVPPTATIGGPYQGIVGSAITFSGNATEPNPAIAAAGFQYNWSFGDGGTSTLQSPGHTYANVGTYTVTLTVTDTAGGTSTVSTTATAYPVGTPLASASFVGVDTSTQGNWGNAYGGDGNAISGDYAQYPAYAQVSLNNSIGFLWAGSTTDVRALTKSSNPSQRIASEWYNPNSFTIDVNLTDGQSHLVALYFLDWTNQGVDETVSVLDASTGNVINSQTVSGCTGGKYLEWNISGHVQIRLTNLNTSIYPNAAASGLFFGPAGHPSTPVVTPTTPVNAYAATSRPFTLGSFSDAWVYDGPWNVTVNWGDSTTSTYSTPAPGALSQAHTYANAGNYAVSVTVTNSHGLSGSAVTAAINVWPPPNPADITAPYIVTPYLSIPNFGAFPTVYSTQSGAWSNPSTWSTGVVPSTGAIVSIEPNTTVTYDVNSTAALNTIIIQPGAQLTFATNITTALTTVNLMVMQGGTLNIGTQANPIAANGTATVIWANQAINTNIDPEQYGNGLIVLGAMNIYGAAKAPYVTLVQTPNAGDTVLHLASSASSWQVGDKLQLPDTRQLDLSQQGSKYTSQVESVTIQAISADGLTITLTTPLQFSHLGAYDAKGVLQYLPQVVDMTRNVSIHSQSATGTRGYALFTARANVSINYTTFGGMGRTTNNTIDNTTFSAGGGVAHLGANEANRNAITFLDLIGPTSPQANGYQFTFNGNVVTCPLNPMPFLWGINVVNSYYGLIQNNDVVNWAGAGIEVDGLSSYNRFNGNFVMRINGTGQRGSGDLGLAGDGLWFGNGNNYVTNNIVTDLAVNGPYGYAYEFYAIGGAGEIGEGAVSIPAFQGADPSVPSQCTTVNMNGIPLLQFAGNEAYGAAPIGISYWWINYNGAQAGVIASGGVISNFVTWNLWSTGIYGYQSDGLTVDGFVCIGSAAELAVGENTQGMQFGDYFTGNLTVQNSNIQNLLVGIDMPVATCGTINIQNCYLANATDIVVPGIYGVGEGCDDLPRTINIDNVQFAQPAGVSTFTTINMCWYAPNQIGSGAGCAVTLLDQVFVHNYNGVSGANFQLFYTQQAATYVVPQTIINPDGSVQVAGAPVAGLTNAQAWAKYGVAVAGAVAPSDATTMNNIDGLLKPI
jgi:PKD repeat protein